MFDCSEKLDLVFGRWHFQTHIVSVFGGDCFSNLFCNAILLFEFYFSSLQIFNYSSSLLLFQLQWLSATGRSWPKTFQVCPVQTQRTQWCQTLQTLHCPVATNIKSHTRCQSTFNIVHIISQSSCHSRIQRGYGNGYVSGE